jgi:hypothetical protein
VTASLEQTDGELLIDLVVLGEEDVERDVLGLEEKDDGKRKSAHRSRIRRFSKAARCRMAEQYTTQERAGEQ